VVRIARFEEDGFTPVTLMAKFIDDQCFFQALKEAGYNGYMAYASVPRFAAGALRRTSMRARSDGRLACHCQQSDRV
jgi:hypothetical protein